MNLAKLVSFSIALLLILAFKHPIEIEGVGDVTSLSGTRGCTYEDATATPVPDNCAKNEVFWRVKNEAKKWVPVDYLETYIAVPRDGWQFDSWANCAFNGVGSTVEIGNTCTFSVPATAVRTEKRATIPPLKAVFTTCTPGAIGCRWLTGDLNTRTQDQWDGTTSWYGSYASIYASTFGIVEVGLPGASGFSMRFTDASRVSDYFVQSGAAAALDKDLDDTTSSSSGQFGGEVLALRLNVDFSATGQLGGTSGLSFGALTLCNMSDASLNGTTVNGLLAIANTLLGGGSSGVYTHAAIKEVVEDVNVAFSDGTPTPFASASLYNGACP